MQNLKKSYKSGSKEMALLHFNYTMILINMCFFGKENAMMEAVRGSITFNNKGYAYGMIEELKRNYVPVRR